LPCRRERNQPFHYRLQEKVLVHEVINGGTTCNCQTRVSPSRISTTTKIFADFMKGAQESVARRIAKPSFQPTARDKLIYFTTLPWLSFTSLAHARNADVENSVPRLLLAGCQRKLSHIDPFFS